MENLPTTHASDIRECHEILVPAGDRARSGVFCGLGQRTLGGLAFVAQASI